MPHDTAGNIVSDAKNLGEIAMASSILGKCDMKNVQLLTNNLLYLGNSI